jgi:hypothetical protein
MIFCSDIHAAPEEGAAWPGSVLGGNQHSVYRLLKAHDLITCPAYFVIKAADEFKDKTTAQSQRRPVP